ncbi:MAG: asparagine synthetase B [Candidatus Dormibacteria bacterium]
MSLFAALRTDGPLDPGTWIVADARIDDCESPGVSDTERILQAFTKWGNRCVDHLLGDFAFAIWDGGARRLLCARDHMGVKPLYYVHARGWLLVSSSVDALRHHPAVSDALDDLAVADFLLFGHKTDPDATTFRDIRRVPPAHTLTWSPEGGCRVSRYWELPVEEPIYRNDRECADELRALVDRAVADRVRGQRVSVFLSGGLDSTIVAASACRQAASRDGDAVRAFSFFHESLLADDERRHAAAAAAHLAIRCDFYETGGSAAWQHGEWPRMPEPLLRSSDPAVQARCLNAAAAHGAIALTGEGADNAMFYEWASYVGNLWRARRFGRIGADAAKFLRHHRRLPLWSNWTRGAASIDGTATPPIPSWMSRDLVARLDLEERWRFVMRPALSRHPARPAAYFSLQLPLWQAVFDEWDPCYTGVALDVRHPWLDIRVLRFLLTVPVIPWCREKHILRYAFADDLPPQVRRRPKTPLSGSLEHAKIARDGLPPVVRSPRLGAYAESADLKAPPTGTAMDAEAALRLVTLSQWLARLESARLAAAAD